MLRGGGKRINVYVYSYLGYGLMAGRAKLIEKDAEQPSCFPKVGCFRTEYVTRGLLLCRPRRSTRYFAGVMSTPRSPIDAIAPSRMGWQAGCPPPCGGPSQGAEGKYSYAGKDYTYGAASAASSGACAKHGVGALEVGKDCKMAKVSCRVAGARARERAGWQCWPRSRDTPYVGASMGLQAPGVALGKRTACMP